MSGMFQSVLDYIKTKTWRFSKIGNLQIPLKASFKFHKTTA